MRLKDTQIVCIVAHRLTGKSWPAIVQLEELDCSAQKLRRTVKHRLFPKATKKR